MGEPTVPQPALLVIGLLAGLREMLLEAEKLLVADFGRVAVWGNVMRFDFTDYYKEEMGEDLLRRWLGFERTVTPGRLAEIKLACNGVERNLAVDGKRRVNIDPGLLTLHSLVLASTKEHAHRVYLAAGIFAELTLIYRSGRFAPQEWTYADYRTEECLSFLEQCRDRLTGAA